MGLLWHNNQRTSFSNMKNIFCLWLCDYNKYIIKSWNWHFFKLACQIESHSAQWKFQWMLSECYCSNCDQYFAILLWSKETFGLGYKLKNNPLSTVCVSVRKNMYNNGRRHKLFKESGKMHFTDWQHQSKEIRIGQSEVGATSGAT